jgi:hypothetical protein
LSAEVHRCFVELEKPAAPLVRPLPAPRVLLVARTPPPVEPERRGAALEVRAVVLDPRPADEPLRRERPRCLPGVLVARWGVTAGASVPAVASDSGVIGSGAVRVSWCRADTPALR